MVYRTEDLKVLHALTDKGEAEYRKILSLKADEILMRRYRPISWLIMKIKDHFGW